MPIKCPFDAHQRSFTTRSPRTASEWRVSLWALMMPSLDTIAFPSSGRDTPSSLSRSHSYLYILLLLSLLLILPFTLHFYSSSFSSFFFLHLFLCLHLQPSTSTISTPIRPPLLPPPPSPFPLISVLQATRKKGEEEGEGENEREWEWRKRGKRWKRREGGGGGSGERGKGRRRIKGGGALIRSDPLVPRRGFKGRASLCNNRKMIIGARSGAAAAGNGSFEARAAPKEGEHAEPPSGECSRRGLAARISGRNNKQTTEKKILLMAENVQTYM